MKKILNIGLIDDEQKSLDLLSTMIEDIPGFEVRFATTSAQKALQMAIDYKPDLMIADIVLPDGHGVWLAERFKNLGIPSILISAEWALGFMGYDVEAVSFLGKPISFSKLNMTLQKFKEQLDPKHDSDKTETIFIKKINGKSLIPIKLSDIVFIKGGKDFADIILDTSDIESQRTGMVRGTLKSLLERFNDQKFIQIHRSYIINREKISAYEYDRIYLLNKYKISIGDTYQPIIRDLFSKEVF